MANYKDRRLSYRWIKERLEYYKDVPDNQVLTQGQAAKVRGMTVQTFVNERWAGEGPRPIVIDVVRKADAKREQHMYLYVMGELRRFEQAQLRWVDSFRPNKKDFRPQPLGELLPMVAKEGALQAQEGDE